MLLSQIEYIYRQTPPIWAPEMRPIVIIFEDEGEMYDDERWLYDPENDNVIRAAVRAWLEIEGNEIQDNPPEE